MDTKNGKPVDECWYYKAEQRRQKQNWAVKTIFEIYKTFIFSYAKNATITRSRDSIDTWNSISLDYI